MEKKLIREEILSKRAKVTKEKREVNSKKRIEKLMASSYYKQAHTIMSFISFSDEVNTHDFIKEAIEDGKQIVVPITFPKVPEIKASILTSFSQLEAGFYNILTPKKEFHKFIDPKEIDLVIVPGLAFSKDGYRVGYGGGYYDRFLSKIPDTTTIAIAFQLQILEDLPTDDFDIPVDYIYTEENIIDCR